MGQSQQQLIAEADHAALRHNLMPYDNINAYPEQEETKEQRSISKFSRTKTLQ